MYSGSRPSLSRSHAEPHRALERVLRQVRAGTKLGSAAIRSSALRRAVSSNASPISAASRAIECASAAAPSAARRLRARRLHRHRPLHPVRSSTPPRRRPFFASRRRSGLVPCPVPQAAPARPLLGGESGGERWPRVEALPASAARAGPWVGPSARVKRRRSRVMTAWARALPRATAARNSFIWPSSVAAAVACEAAVGSASIAGRPAPRAPRQDSAEILLGVRRSVRPATPRIFEVVDRLARAQPVARRERRFDRPFGRRRR